jgi:hypothetical protein
VFHKSLKKWRKNGIKNKRINVEKWSYFNIMDPEVEKGKNANGRIFGGLEIYGF